MSKSTTVRKLRAVRWYHFWHYKSGFIGGIGRALVASLMVALAALLAQ